MFGDNHEQFVDLIPAYALGVLAADEQAAVAAHLATCAHCQEELAAYESVVAALPLAAAPREPAPELRGRLLDQVRPAPAAAKLAGGDRGDFWARLRAFLARPQPRPALALIALFLLLAVYFSALPAVAPPQQVILDPTDFAPAAAGQIEFTPDGDRATLTVSGLPRLPADQQYQLWLIEGEARLSGAVFSVAADGTAEVTVNAGRAIDAYDAIGITIEPAGGSPGPTGERVLGHNL